MMLIFLNQIPVVLKTNIIDKSSVLYIGDNDIDYFTANNANVDSLLVSWGPREIKCIDKAKYNAKSYNEIGEILLWKYMIH